MKIIFLTVLQFITATVFSQKIISSTYEKGVFILTDSSGTADIYVDDQEEVLTRKAAALFAEDIEKVSGKKPVVINKISSAKEIVIIGSIHSPLLKQLAAAGKIRIKAMQGKWEAFIIQVIDHPFKGVDKALVIAGSDRRGTAYGVVTLSGQMGVSPWHWWADVPVKTKKNIYINARTIYSDAPKVKYRGIFINDEAPALSNWAKEKFGGFNHLFYEKVCELILRLRGNYLWPAMWGNAFYDDDSLNAFVADAYGIVIGTSHHEPLMRAHDEWRRFGEGPWDYDSNETRLKEFWRGGMQRAWNEKLVSVGMRGDGDKPMSRETATGLLEKIVRDQRKIIEEVTGRPTSATPQLWALYKEVQDYYDKGMRVPDDVTLLLCDDNWGNIRKLPRPTDPSRKGGYGIYYHFDYVGGPRNYKWINTNNISRVWEQMHLAYAHGVDRIWIVNVGDIKPMEFPISFFLDYAWDPGKWNESNLHDYYTQWAEKQFGTLQAKEIGDIIRTCSQYNARKKPELLAPDTYSILNYHEAEKIAEDYSQLLDTAEKIRALLSPEYADAFYQLVLHPVKAAANLHAMYTAIAYNRYYAARRQALANTYADSARQFYINDSVITLAYHRIGGAKWNHMMDQTHIGYTSWQQPPVNQMPDVKYLSVDSILPPPELLTQLPEISTKMSSPNKTGNRFYEVNGHISMEAAHWTRELSPGNIKWKVIPDIGRTGDGVTTFPVTARSQLSATSAHLDYEFYSNDTGSFKIRMYFSPTLNIYGDEGLKYAVSVDNSQPEIQILNEGERNVRTWEKWVADNIIIKSTTHRINLPGKHVVHFWMISPAVVLQKIVLDFGGVKPSYLGPPEKKYEP